MNRRIPWMLAALLGAAVLTSGVLAAGPSGPALTGVPRANTEVDGYAPASKLSPELQQVVGRPGLDEAREPVGADLLLRLRQRRRSNAAGEPQMVPTPAHRDRGAEDRAGQEHLPRLQARPARRRRRATTTARTSSSRATRAAPAARLHHPHQPRRRRGAPRDAAGDDGRRRRTARDDRRLDLGSVGEAAAVHDGERERADLRGDAGLPVDGHRRLRRARPRRLRGHPERLRRATSGSSRTSAAPSKPGTTAKRPNSFVYRYVPQAPGRPRSTASCRCCRC